MNQTPASQSGGSILDWIDVGPVSAERDPNLSSYFYDNGVLGRVCSSDEFFLILGRKGAGKTAVFRYLNENQGEFLKPDDVLIPLSLVDYNWRIHNLLGDPAKAPAMQFSQSWRFAMLVEMLGAATRSFQTRSVAPPPEIERATKLLERLFGSPTPGIREVIGQKLLGLTKLQLPKAGIGEDGLTLDGGAVSFDRIDKDPELKASLTQNVEHLLAYLDDAIVKNLDLLPKTFIAIDRVDEAWEEASFDLARPLIAGLVSACEGARIRYKGRLRPLLFLREDIFKSLRRIDANKLLADSGQLLNWDRDSLSRMILRRINHYANAAGQSPFDSLDGVFDCEEMRQRATPTRHLVRRTMARPRDLIALLRNTIDVMKDEAANAEIAVAAERLTCQAIYDAEPKYSEWLQEELLEEWRVQQPVIEALLNAFRNFGSTNVTDRDLAEQLRRLGQTQAAKDIQEHLRFLFDNSIIGLKLGSSTEWRFKCFYPSQGYLQQDEYRVHEGLVRALNLTEARRSGGSKLDGPLVEG
jgi:hypothetical protein